MTNSRRVWLIADYRQAEIMVAAWAGPIPKMKEWFKNSEDIHLHVAKLIGRIVQENKIKMPRNLWNRKPWNELNADDPEDHDNERDLAKRTVHANTNGMYRMRFALITGLPVMYAGRVQDIYHDLFPEIRGNYHKWIRDTVNDSGTLTNPLGWKRTFYKVNPLGGGYDEEEYRIMYAWYPQSTIGLLTLRMLTQVCETFAEDLPEARILTPSSIRSMGYDVQLEVHDMIGVSLPDDATLVADATRFIKSVGEYSMVIKGDELVIPIDFKVGYNFGELKKYVIR